ncbi:MAG: SAM-dependent methyltransferase, partial [Solimonas sp.]
MQASKRWLALLLSTFAIAAAADDWKHALAPGQAATRAPDVRYEPTPHNVVAEMLKLAQVGANDVVYDLGCGDGRI